MFKHLEETQKTYVHHMLGALENVVHTQLVCIALLIHTFIPCVFVKTFSDFIKKTYEKIT